MIRGMKARQIDEAALAALDERVAQDLEFLNYGKRSWVPRRSHPSGRPVYDVLIVGAGHAGLTTAFGLKRDRVHNILVVDRNPPGHAGPWATYARMPLLRTPKEDIGPDLGIPSLTPRAWYTACHGAAAWKELLRLPRLDFQHYLDWYRSRLDLPLRFETALTRIEPDAADDPNGLLRLTLEDTAGRHETVFAREVVLATGMDGGGAWYVPEVIRDNLPVDRFAHMADDIDFSGLAGKRVAVLGGGTAGFDNAAEALKAGATAVDHFMRRDHIPRINAWRWLGGPHILRHFYELDDPQKWRAMRHVLQVHQPPPQETWDRCTAYPAYHVHLAAAWCAARVVAGEIEVETTQGHKSRHDFVIAATGCSADLQQRRELDAIVDQIALWRDRFTAPSGEEHEDLANAPYLGDGYEFCEKVPGSAPYLQHIRCFSYGSIASLGNSGASISAVEITVPRLLDRLTRALFRADSAAHYAAVFNQNEHELVAHIPGEVVPDPPRRPNP